MTGVFEMTDKTEVFALTFPPTAERPTKEAIREEVTDHFKQLGYGHGHIEMVGDLYFVGKYWRMAVMAKIA